MEVGDEEDSALWWVRRIPKENKDEEGEESGEKAVDTLSISVQLPAGYGTM